MKSRTWIGLRSVFSALLLFAQLCWVGGASAQLPIPPSTEFDITGFLQEATLDSTCVADPHCGGTLRLNGHTVTVPKETIVILPASALTWQEMFAFAPAPYGLATVPPSLGMAMADSPVPLTTYEFHVIGNRVLGGAGGTDQYIAGLIYLAQQGLNSGAGFINFMDYTNGEMRVGGIINDPNCTQGGANLTCSGTRVRINDPANPTSANGGRYGRAMSPDPRFTVDQDNPTIMAGTGFPMCFPRFDPLVQDDADCPAANRPLGVTNIQMNPPLPPGVAQPRDPRKQVPMQVGDFITFSGTLVTDAPQPTAGPFPGTAGTYVSAHTIVSNVAVFTVPGTDPAYVMTEVTLIGTGGLTVLGVGEAVIRTRFEGMTTDISRNIHLYGMDINPVTGAVTDRDWGTIGVDPGPAGGGAVQGRWRFRPPCLAFGTVPLKADKQCVMNQSGTFLPVPREMRAVIEGLQSQNPANPGALTAANGIYYGQYHAPIQEYIFPENVPGSPIVENNFNTVDFLAQGGYTSAAGTQVKQLNPWPSNIVPGPVCTAPVATSGGPYTVAANGTVQLLGSATGTTPSFAWTAGSGSLSNAAIANPVFNAVGAVSPVALTLTASNACGSSTVSTTVTVNAATNVATIASVPAITVVSGARGTFALSAVNPSNPLQNVIFTVTQAGAPALTGLSPTYTGTKLNPSTVAAVTFNAPVLPLGQVASSQVTLTITAKIGAGPVSAPITVPVTIVPIPDTITLTTEYRISKQRLVITAVSTNPGVTMTLKPYLTDDGVTIYDPVALGNTFAIVGGIPTLTLVGAPRPACNPGGVFQTPCARSPLKVDSDINGSSGFQAIQKIRQ